MATATKTLNPLHFEDLEPHRFEDLSRQLIYDFRNWSSIEAIGRLGSDEGVDIRAIGKLIDVVSPEEIEDTEIEFQNTTVEHVWIIQCKREKTITPKKVESIIKNDLSQQEQIPYGYILIAACDFSKKTRDAFRSSVLSFGVQEFYIWGKAEIEDLLFQPKNDHLLFAYFGISLQIRRRSIKTDLRAILTLKRKLVTELGAMQKHHNKPVFIRDPRDKDYPLLNANLNEIEQLPWRYWEFYGYYPGDLLLFVTRKCFAFFDQNKKQWDALLDLDNAFPSNMYLHGSKEIEIATNNKYYSYWNYWNTKVPPANQAYYIELRAIPFERIYLVDEIGDAWHKPPHLLVEYSEPNHPFNPKMNQFIKPGNRHDSHPTYIDELAKIKYFPDGIPEIEN